MDIAEEKTPYYHRKNTKIVATISNKNCSVELVRRLYEAGMNVVRLNTAHMGEEGIRLVCENVRQVSDKIAILLDTKGPEIRTVHIAQPLVVSEGQMLWCSGEEQNRAEPGFMVSYRNVHKELQPGGRILINDGQIELTVMAVDETALLCRVDNEGSIQNRKSVNIPGARLNLPTLTPRDIENIELGVKLGIDFIAHSFVRSADDVLTVKRLCESLNSTIKIIAKIENRQGVDNIDEILEHAYGVMVARGDLGVEVAAAEVPLIQKHIIGRCIRRAKPVIVATQMLESMITNPRPTRAEVSDVANAILDGAGSVMLSGETAYGEYPVAAVRTISEIALDVQKHAIKANPEGVDVAVSDVNTFLAKAAVDAALALNASAIVVPTLTGATARLIASLRSHKPIYAPCYSDSVMRQLAMSHGIRAGRLKHYESAEELIYNCAKYLLEKDELPPHSLVVVVAGTPSPHLHRSDLLKIATLQTIIGEFEQR